MWSFIVALVSEDVDLTAEGDDANLAVRSVHCQVVEVTGDCLFDTVESTSVLLVGASISLRLPFS